MSTKQSTGDPNYIAYNVSGPILKGNASPPVYSFQANSNIGTYKSTTSTSITLDVREGKLIVVNKYNIPVGALVFIRTKNPDYAIQDFFRAPAATSINPWITGGTVPFSNPAWVYTPSITTCGDVVTPYYTDPVTGKEFDINIDSTISDELQELFDAYNKTTNPPGGTGTFGGTNNGLGMIFMRNKQKSKRMKKVSKPKLMNLQAANSVTTGVAGYWSSNQSGIRNVSSNTATVAITPQASQAGTGPVYKVTGYKTVEDCLQWHKSVDVVQDSYTEDELEEIFKETGAYPEIGQPFSGIVVDKFVPKLFTVNGNEIDASHLPILYKVLVDEKNILWIPEGEVAPMQPKSCPLKEEKAVEEGE